MASPFSGYISNDGKAFENEIDAVAHDVKREIEKSFPEMKTILRHDANFNRLLETLQPLTDLIHQDQTYPAETTLEPGNHPAPKLLPGQLNVEVPGYYDLTKFEYHAGADITQVYFNGEPAVQTKPGVWTAPRCSEDEHDWETGLCNGLVDRCRKCGEERA